MPEKSKRNLTVLARNTVDGFYYTGYITRAITEEDICIRVIFHKIKQHDVPVDHVIYIRGAVPCPDLQLRDYVLVRARCKTNSIECYVPGRVMCVPVECRLRHMFYTVILYTNELHTETRRYIVKINKKQYGNIVGYIKEICNEQPLNDDLEIDPDPFRVEPLNPPSAEEERSTDDRRTVAIQHTNTGCTHHHKHYHYEISKSPSSSVDKKHKGTSTDNPFTPRRSLLKPGEDVLARWKDDGWYYFGMVVAPEYNGSVRVLDSTGYEENIPFDDILISSGSDEIQKNDYIVALHPRYVYSYAPATVENVHVDGYHVKFYDGMTATLPRNEIYLISHRKFKESVEYIKQQEVNLIGQLVIARDDDTGSYVVCQVEDVLSHEQKVVLQFPNRAHLIQSSVHIFPLDVRRFRINLNWKHVLGSINPTCSVYRPAKIVYRHPLQLEFCGETGTDQVTPSECFYMSDLYYRNAVGFFESKRTTLLQTV